MVAQQPQGLPPRTLVEINNRLDKCEDEVDQRLANLEEHITA